MFLTLLFVSFARTLYGIMFCEATCTSGFKRHSRHRVDCHYYRFIIVVVAGVNQIALLITREK